VSAAMGTREDLLLASYDSLLQRYAIFQWTYVTLFTHGPDTRKNNE